MSGAVSDHVVVRCPCGQRLRVKAQAIGHRVRCPGCSQVFSASPEGSTAGRSSALPASETGVTLLDAPDGSRVIKVRCACGKKIGLRPEWVGRRAKCPACGHHFTVPDPHPVLAAQSSAEDDLFSSLDELAEQEQSAESVGAPALESQQPCPGCGKPVAAEAVVCVLCGYHLKTGRRLGTKVASGAAAGETARKAARSAGTFALGCVLSVVGALIGAGVWCAVAVITNYEIGWIAWGLGLLAGGGMLLGFRRQRMIAGLAAAGIAVLGIFSAKLMMVYYVNRESIAAMSELVRIMGDESGQSIYELARHEAVVEAQAQGLSYSDPKRRAMLEPARAKYREMTDGELEQAHADLVAWEAGGKWDDAQWVRNDLIYSYIDQMRVLDTGADDPQWASVEGVSEAEWQTLYEGAREKVDALTSGQQLAAAREFEAQEKHRDQRARLAIHAADLRGRRSALPPAGEEYESLYEEELAEFEKLSDEELDAAIARLDAWEAGEKWSDAEYVRMFLIYHFAEEAVAQDEDDDGVTVDQWKPAYSRAEARVNGIPAEEQPARARQIEADQQRRSAQAVAEFKERYKDGAVTIVTRDAAGSVWKSMFNVFDILFTFLAIGSAYRLAGGSWSERA